MKKISTSAILILLLITMSQHLHAQHIQDTIKYFLSPSKLGLVVLVVPIHYYRNTTGIGIAGSAIDMSLQGEKSKYDDALKAIEPDVFPGNKITNMYKEIYTGFGKQVGTISASDLKGLKIFNKQKGIVDTTEGGKKYFAKDLRFLQEKYQIDEVLIVLVDYGIRTNHVMGFLEMSKRGMATISTVIVNVHDNSVVMRENTFIQSIYHHTMIKGKWNIPPYDNLKSAVNRATEAAMKHEKEKYANIPPASVPVPPAENIRTGSH